MKKIVLVAVLLIGIIVGGFWWAGATIARRFPEFIARAAALGQLEARIDSYERGIFRSSARTTIVLRGMAGQEESVTLLHEIWHGPLPFGTDRAGNLHLAPAAAVIESRLAEDTASTGMFGELLTLLPELRTLHEITTISFSGNGQVDIALPPFTRDFVEDEIKTTVEWGGLTGSETFDADLTNISGRFDIPGLRITQPTFSLAFEQINSNFRLNLAANGLLLGRIDLNAGNITGGERGADPAFVLKGFGFRNAARQEGETIGYSVEMVADTLVAAGRQLGPLGFEIDFSNLDTATIVSVQQQLQALQLDMIEPDPQLLGERVLAIYGAALPELLKRAPQISLNYLRIQSPDGELWGKGSVVFDGSDGAPVTDFARVTEIVRGSGELHISATLLRSLLREFSAPQLAQMRAAGQMGEIDDETFATTVDQAVQGQVAALLAQGTLVEDGANYRMVFTYKERQALLNDRPLTLF